MIKNIELSYIWQNFKSLSDFVYTFLRSSRVALLVKKSPASAGDRRDADLIPGSGRSPGGRHGNPLQCSCLENSMDGGACQATVHRVTKNRT